MHQVRTPARLIRLTLVVTALGSGPAVAEGPAPPLGAYNADIKESSISGISSGAFMAVQFGVSWSSIVKGVGVIAGGPYYCAQGTAVNGLLGNLGPGLAATGPCMKGPVPDLEPLFEKTDEWARGGDIDDPHNIANQRIYILPTAEPMMILSLMPVSPCLLAELLAAGTQRPKHVFASRGVRGASRAGCSASA